MPANRPLQSTAKGDGAKNELLIMLDQPALAFGAKSAYYQPALGDAMQLLTEASPAAAQDGPAYDSSSISPGAVN